MSITDAHQIAADTLDDLPAELLPITERSHLCPACLGDLSVEDGEPLVHRAGAQAWCELPELGLAALRDAWGHVQVAPQCTLTDNRTETMSLAELINYALTTEDVDPLYLHWRPPAHVADHVFGRFDVPAHLDNWFDILPDELRPTMRWILIGPPNSGTRMHADIFGTTAWNAVISGLKLWIFASPEQLTSDRASELDVFATEANLANLRLRYCIQHPGDLVIAPSGWWHQVLNLRPTLAVTENLVNATNYTYVRQWFLDHNRPKWASIIDEVTRRCLTYQPILETCTNATSNKRC